MKAIQSSTGIIRFLTAWLVSACWLIVAQGAPVPLVRIAEIEIDAAQVEAYKAALREERETSLRLEPGVLTLYAVSLKENPAPIKIFETYADRKLIRIASQDISLREYKTTTERIIQSLRLVETDPIHLGAKPK